MPVPFAIIGSIFALVCVVCFNLSHVHLALLFATIAVVSFIIAIFLNFNKSKKSKTKKNEINLQEFTLVKNHYTHPKYPNQDICPSCLISKGRVSPVLNGYCTVCRQPLSDTLGDVFIAND